MTKALVELDIDHYVLIGADIYINLRYLHEYRYIQHRMFTSFVMRYGGGARTSDLFRGLSLILSQKRTVRSTQNIAAYKFVYER